LQALSSTPPKGTFNHRKPNHIRNNSLIHKKRNRSKSSCFTCTRHRNTKQIDNITCAHYLISNFLLIVLCRIFFFFEQELMDIKQVFVNLL
jgi:hypothetical protein